MYSPFLWEPVDIVIHHKVELTSPTTMKRGFGISTITTMILLAIAEGTVALTSLIQTGAMFNALYTVIEQ